MKELTEREEKMIIDLAYALGVFQCAVDAADCLKDYVIYKQKMKFHLNKSIEEMESILSIIDEHRFDEDVDTKALNEEEMRNSKMIETISKMVMSLTPKHHTGFFNDMQMIFTKYHN